MTIVLTGGSRGIGRALINFFLQIKQVKLIVLSSNPGKLKKLSESKNFGLYGIDLRNGKDLIKIISEIKKKYGTVDILINNAATLLNKPFEKINTGELENVYRTNVFAPFMLIQQLVPLMGKKSKGHVVNISSMGGFMGSSKFAGLSAYSSSKGALSILSECLAEELKDKNISVNCLCLGSVDTEMLKQAFPGYKANTSAKEMANFIGGFALNGSKTFNGKVLPVSASTP